MLNGKSRRSDAAVAVLAALIAVSLAACSGKALSTTGPSAGFAGDAPSTVILSASLDNVEVGGQRVLDFSLPYTGTLTLTVRENDQSNSVVALLTGAGCPRVSGYAPVCEVRRSVERQGKEGREGVIDYPGASGAYRLLVENEGPGVDSIQVTAALSSPPAIPVLPTPYPTSNPPERPRSDP